MTKCSKTHYRCLWIQSVNVHAFELKQSYGTYVCVHTLFIPLMYICNCTHRVIKGLFLLLALFPVHIQTGLLGFNISFHFLLVYLKLVFICIIIKFCSLTHMFTKLTWHSNWIFPKGGVTRTIIKRSFVLVVYVLLYLCHTCHCFVSQLMMKVDINILGPCNLWPCFMTPGVIFESPN
jgi:hypothetical protein